MPALERERVMQLLSARAGMTDFSLFVGRKTELQKLAGVVDHPHSCAWIFGPPRNGKSSLARLALDRARQNGNRAVMVDASSVPPGDFDELLARVLIEAGEGRPSLESTRAVFTGLAKRTKDAPLLIVFDEFDRHAMRFGLDEQAFLRSHNATYPTLNYLFVTRSNPKHLVENVAVSRSRLLTICTVFSIPILDPSEVARLCQLVAEAFQMDHGAAWAEEIARSIGGHPSTVMDVLYNLAAGLMSDGAEALALEDVIERQRDSLADSLRQHWHALPVPCRLFLLATGATDDELQRSAELEGYWNRRRKIALLPAILLQVARSEGAAAVEARGNDGVLALLRELHQLMELVNLSCQRAGKPDVFMPPNNEVFRYYQLDRPMHSEHDLYPAIEHLARLIYEGARGRGGMKDIDAAEWRINDENARYSFATSRGIQLLRDLQGYFRPSGNKPDSSREEQHIGDWFQRVCGDRTPRSAAQFEAIVRFLLDELIAAVRGLAEDLRAL